MFVVTLMLSWSMYTRKPGSNKIKVNQSKALLPLYSVALWAMRRSCSFELSRLRRESQKLLTSEAAIISPPRIHALSKKAGTLPVSPMHINRKFEVPKFSGLLVLFVVMSVYRPTAYSTSSSVSCLQQQQCSLSARWNPQQRQGQG